jgi:hypothetical protein
MSGLIFGKKLKEYLQFQKWLLAFVVLVFIVRVAFSIRWASLNGLEIVGLLYYAVAVPLRSFGSYKQLLVLLFNQIALTHVLIALGIGIAIATGWNNILTRPEFSGGGNGRTWLHASLHIVAMTMLPFTFWGVGAPILWITKKLRR